MEVSRTSFLLFLSASQRGNYRKSATQGGKKMKIKKTVKGKELENLLSGIHRFYSDMVTEEMAEDEKEFRAMAAVEVVIFEVEQAFDLSVPITYRTAIADEYITEDGPADTQPVESLN
jgi:hypothetical protein